MPEKQIRRKIEILLKALGRPCAEISILFSGDSVIRALNRRYRGNNKTTDVLAFAFRDGAYPGVQPDILGDIVISVPQASRQAAEAGHSLEREIDILIIHGLLHLLGYDHEKGIKEAARMQRKERALLKKIGQ